MLEFCYLIFLTYSCSMFLFHTPLKTPENLWFSGVFWGYKMGTSDKIRLVKSMGVVLQASPSFKT